VNICPAKPPRSFLVGLNIVQTAQVIENSIKNWFCVQL